MYIEYPNAFIHLEMNTFILNIKKLVACFVIDVSKLGYDVLYTSVKFPCLL